MRPAGARHGCPRLLSTTGVIALAFLTTATDARLAAQQESALPPVFAVLEGAWEGSGVLLGRPAAFEMRWETGTSGFVHLSFSNAWVEEGGGSTPGLSARATYLVDGASASGVWIDDRPQRIQLEALVTDSSVVTEWTATSERGRTEYIARSGETIVVRDFVIVEGAERLFAEAVYRRVATAPVATGEGPVTETLGAVSGVVMDVDGVALDFVLIGDAASPWGMVSDSLGRFTMDSLPVGRTTLVFQSIGFETQEVVVGVPESGSPVDLIVTLARTTPWLCPVSGVGACTCEGTLHPALVVVVP